VPGREQQFDEHDQAEGDKEKRERKIDPAPQPQAAGDEGRGRNEQGGPEDERPESRSQAILYDGLPGR